METTRSGESDPLFQRIGEDGSTWLFSILPGGGWVIACNDQPVAMGTDEHSSIDAGVKRFAALARRREAHPNAIQWCAGSLIALRRQDRAQPEFVTRQVEEIFPVWSQS